MKKVAVCTGLNLYPNPANNLKGCCNDAMDWASYLKNKQGVLDVSIVLNANVKIKPTIDLIVAKLNTCVSGDHFIFTNSSHGSNIPDRNGDEVDFRDEVLCWYDEFFCDDNFRQIIDSAPTGVNVTIISDSCHSGTVTREFVQDIKIIEGYKRAKVITPEDASFAAMLHKLPVKRRAMSTGISEENMREVLISGCKSDEYSYDAFIQGRNNGAFTRACLDILNNAANLTYTQFYSELRKKLPSGEYPQTPQLEGSLSNKSKIMFS